jgi:membrane protease YdiL (CAAX protease family)
MLRGTVGRHRLLVFYLLAYTLSWVPGFAYGMLAARGPFASPLVPVLLLLAASYGPTLAALLALALLREPGETRAFRHHLGTWRGGIGWYALALLLPAALWAAGSLLADTLFGGGVAFMPAAAAAFPALLLANAGEEIGWRAFAFPHLLARWRPLAASLVFGALWAGIHLPLYVAAIERFAILVPLFLGLSVLMAWIYLHTGQGVLPMLLFHGSLDTVQFVLPLSQAAQATQGTLAFAAVAAVSVVAAALVLWRTGGDLGLGRVDGARGALTGAAAGLLPSHGAPRPPSGDEAGR